LPEQRWPGLLNLLCEKVNWISKEVLKEDEKYKSRRFQAMDAKAEENEGTIKWIKNMVDTTQDRNEEMFKNLIEKVDFER